MNALEAVPSGVRPTLAATIGRGMTAQFVQPATPLKENDAELKSAEAKVKEAESSRLRVAAELKLVVLHVRAAACGVDDHRVQALAGERIHGLGRQALRGLRLAGVRGERPAAHPSGGDDDLVAEPLIQAKRACVERRDAHEDVGAIPEDAGLRPLHQAAPDSLAAIFRGDAHGLDVACERPVHVDDQESGETPVQICDVDLLLRLADEGERRLVGPAQGDPRLGARHEARARLEVRVGSRRANGQVHAPYDNRPIASVATRRGDRRDP